MTSLSSHPNTVGEVGYFPQKGRYHQSLLKGEEGLYEEAQRFVGRLSSSRPRHPPVRYPATQSHQVEDVNPRAQPYLEDLPANDDADPPLRIRRNPDLSSQPSPPNLRPRSLRRGDRELYEQASRFVGQLGARRSRHPPIRYSN